jgi:hypothetical protein
LAIFVGTKVAIKNHAQFINNMELIETMPPGLYEIVITEKPGIGGSSEDEADDFDLSIEERGLDDIRAMGCNSLEDEREFAAVARISELNNALYETFVQPWIKMMSGPQLAGAVLELNSLRLSYSLLSDKNPMMRAVAPLAEVARTKWVAASVRLRHLARQEADNAERCRSSSTIRRPGKSSKQNYCAAQVQYWFDGRRPTDRSLDGHRACIAIPAPERGGLTASWPYSPLMLVCEPQRHQRTA